MHGINAVMGYILHAIFVTGTDHAELKEFHEEFISASNSNELANLHFTNVDTILFLTKTLQGYGAEKERVELIAQVLYWLFDSHTVEEAEEFHKAYQFILRTNVNL